MGINGVPPRWEEYSTIGKLIPQTSIIPFKVPLREEICRNLNDSNLKFTVDDLVLELRPIKLTLVVDLTMTTRFYNKEDLEKYGIKHEKIFIRGGGSMPKEADVKIFCDIISDHLKNNPNGIVGVHCTHGVNRTGYFICRYMIDCLGIMGSTSVDLFEKARGHCFDRENYREFLKNKRPHNSVAEVYSSSKERNSTFSEASKKSAKSEHSDWSNYQHRSYIDGQNTYKRSKYYNCQEGYCNGTRKSINFETNGYNAFPENREFDYASSSSLMNETSFDNNNFSDYRSYKLFKERDLVKSQNKNDRQPHDVNSRSQRSTKRS